MATREVFGTASGAVGATTWAVDTSAFATGDVIGPVAPAPIIFPLGTVDVGRRGVIRSLRIIDNDAQSAANDAGELWLFSSTVTPAAGNAAHSISDADAAKLVGIIPILAANVFASALNAVITIPNQYIPFAVTGTSLFGILVSRAAPTYAGGVLTIALTIDGLD